MTIPNNNGVNYLFSLHKWPPDYDYRKIQHHRANDTSGLNRLLLSAMRTFDSFSIMF